MFIAENFQRSWKTFDIMIEDVIDIFEIMRLVVVSFERVSENSQIKTITSKAVAFSLSYLFLMISLCLSC